ncbi:4-hydroxy-tetrahydrodipicolinate synthase [Eubacteriales bacterium OttesenSCG-928-M02]|nr:4-hydroxy-tetrahydrodipicolinate synthase [Eubacteriales bacterium OttesenSCG-928-M02]
MAVFKGSCTAMITPFTETGIDFDAFGKFIDFQIEGGIDALLILGTTGEPPTITGEERDDIIRFAIDKINKRVPAIVSTGTNNTKTAIEYSKKAQDMGADMLMAVTPYYNKTTPDGLIAHYNAIGDAVSLPIMVYNVPARTGLNLLPAVFARIAEHKNIVAIKEASGSIQQGMETMRLSKGKADLYSGEDALTVPLMAMGAMGIVSVASNIIPGDIHNLCATAFAGDYPAAAALQQKLNPLVDALFSETSPIPVKTAAKLLGLCDDIVRLPLCPITDGGRERLIAAMQAYGLSV